MAMIGNALEFHLIQMNNSPVKNAKGSAHKYDNSCKEYLLYFHFIAITETDITARFKNKRPLSSYLHLMLDHENNEATILSLNTKERIRGRGYATKLISKAIEMAIKDPNIYSIHVDDMSNNYRLKNNIYIKCGFEYVENDSPEMILKTPIEIRIIISDGDCMCSNCGNIWDGNAQCTCHLYYHDKNVVYSATCDDCGETIYSGLHVCD